jgi:hypothetical protein
VYPRALPEILLVTGTIYLYWDMGIYVAAAVITIAIAMDTEGLCNKHSYMFLQIL